MTASKARTLGLLALAGAAGLLSGPVASRPVPQSHEALTVLGVLVCSLVKGSDAAPAAQARDVLCHFTPGRQGTEETYAGRVQGIGQTAALYGKGAVILEVRAPATTEIVPGMLQQVYAAETSPAGAAAPLVGETNRTIILQPLTEEEGRVAAGKTRPDAVLVLVELKLKSSPA